MAKTVKKSLKTRKGRITRPQVISFRITAAQWKMLKEIHEREPATNVKSFNQRCRKWTIDFLAGRLEYKNPADKMRDLEAVAAV